VLGEAENTERSTFSREVLSNALQDIGEEFTGKGDIVSLLPTIGLWYDFRNPRQWRRRFEDLYRESIEQISWAEGLGFGSVWLTEHHFCDDGYTPSPLVLAAAIAQRTRKIRIGTNLMVLPLHNPVRIAEDAATLSLLSDGRFSLGVGQGYWQREFEAFGKDLRFRPSYLEEGIELIRRCWRGDADPFVGRRYQLSGLPVTPTPEKAIPILVGAMQKVSIERVARIADGFLSTQNDHHSMYLEALKDLGRDPSEGRIYAGQWAIIADDPERVWSEIGDHALYQLNQYVSWGAFGPPDIVPEFADREAILASGAFELWDASTAVDRICTMVEDRPQIQDLHFWAQLPGESIESGSSRIEYIANNVLPRIKQRLSVEDVRG
jgi:alkanesulfonate monooxygenase SsuD/methylene tetrahydromethanopterin reductase-like flavin-dependent oxidoreductase (luciferase family)